VHRTTSTNTAHSGTSYYHEDVSYPKSPLNNYNTMHHALKLQPDIYSTQDWAMDEEAADVPIPSPGYGTDVSFQYTSGDDHSDEAESPAFTSKLHQVGNDSNAPMAPIHRNSFDNSPVAYSPSRSSHPYTPPMQWSPVRRGVSPGKNQNLTLTTSPLGFRSPASVRIPPGWSPNPDVSSYDEYSGSDNENAVFLDEINNTPAHPVRPMARLSMDGGLTSASFHVKRHSLPGHQSSFSELSELETSLTDSANQVPGIPRSISSVLPTTKFEVRRRPVTITSGTDRTLTDSTTESLNNSARSLVDNSLMIKLGLPQIPDSVITFDAKRLSSRDYERCQELWSLSQMSRWVYSLQTGEMEIRYTEVVKALVGLFTHFIPTFNRVRAERMAEDVLQSLTSVGFVISTEDENLQFDSAKIPTGVFPLITGKGCYTDVHNVNDEAALSSLRCYSSKCSRTIPLKGNMLPNVNLKEPVDSNGDWASYWKISDEQIEEIDKREAKKQYAIHELIMGEESYVRDLTTLLSVFGESLKKLNVPPIMTDQDLFWQHSFGSVKTLIDCNSEHLLRAFKYRQQQQGPYIEGVADVILSWLETAREPYMSYADSYLYTDRRIRREKESNQGLSSWLERASKDPRAKGVPYSFYFHRAIPRLARYGLLLRTIQKSTMNSDPEWQLLERCITECDKLTGECNKRLARVEKTMELLDLQEQLQFKSPEVTVNLRIKDTRRKIIRRGDVVRRGEYKLDWIEAHIILLDNFLILSKIRKGLNGTKYYISRRVCWKIIVNFRLLF
jgi:hypothetical protein